MLFRSALEEETPAPEPVPEPEPAPEPEPITEPESKPEEAAVPPVREETSKAADGTYTVKPGDCLWSIAQKTYGAGRQWILIYNANKSVIKEPDQIRIGQVLVLPAA